jgi:anti-anti-sigma factor
VGEALPPQTTASCRVPDAPGVLRLTGDIDQDNVTAVTERVIAAVNAGATHLDLSEVSFFGAAGVRAVLTGHQALPPHVTALRVTCSPIVLRVLHACGLAGPAQLRLQVVAAEHLPRQQRPEP